ncbi:MAG: CBS domain-containing protein [Anaerolineae bacterium]|nr:CBS domain-containing protein [Anaerolineae bacterium]
MKLILTHDHADFDALAAMFAAAKLNPEHVPILPDQLNANVSRFLTLYGSGLPFVSRSQVTPKRIEQVIAVDTQRVTHWKGMGKKTYTLIIDHHPLAVELKPNQSFSGEVMGACTTLLVEQIEKAELSLNPLEATLLTLGIYEDTGSLGYGTTRSRDLRGAAWLLDQGAVLDTVRQFLAHPFDDSQQILLSQLIQGAETRQIRGHSVTVADARMSQHVSEISTVAHRLRDLLDTEILLVLVQLPASLHLVARSTVDTVELGSVARTYGGGGHRRAAAATVKDHTFAEVKSSIWQIVEQYISPVTMVRDLMSYGVYTIEADLNLKEVAPRLRRIGHEGYPVVEHGRLIGLLSRRDLDRALEHGLGHLRVRDVMNAGSVAIQPDDSFDQLQRIMIDSDRGQIPVIDGSGQVLGIVTRTDVLSHWRRLHNNPGAATESLNYDQIRNVLGVDAALAIQRIAEAAQANGQVLYLVGGCVRDLLLARRNLDLDFVVEGDGIALACQMAANYGGDISAYTPFGTATWKLEAAVAQRLGVQTTGLPDHIDFVTARNEYYETPTALPTVYRGSIKLDLARRDFTINTLAIQLSPLAANGRLLDPFHGVKDLRAKIIRVLHNLSFVDDPTRILRAYRFSHRLGFEIEARTNDLINTAMPMLARITGERLRNEFTLIFQEERPEQILSLLDKRGILHGIHPEFTFPSKAVADFERARHIALPWNSPDFSLDNLYWHILARHLNPESLSSFGERLLIPTGEVEAWLATRQLLEAEEWLNSDLARPSKIVERLNKLPESALLASWFLMQSAVASERIVNYSQRWRYIRPSVNGNDLRQLGLPPGPCYSLILKRLRDGLLDGELAKGSDELTQIKKWIADGICSQIPIQNG